MVVTPRILFVSGSIGLGHAERDLAIARELRRMRPAIEIEWLAGDPAAQLIQAAGERLLAESKVFQETGFAERSARGFSLNIPWYLTHAAGAWLRAARTVLSAVEERGFDLVIGDETYELAIAFVLRPGLKKVPFAIIYDFFGLDAMSRNPLERLLVYGLNWMWGGGRRGKPPRFDLVLCIGEPEDIPDRPLGVGLPNRRRYARHHFEFIGYVFGFDPAEYQDKATARSALGYDDRPLVLCSIGGTAVGADLLRLCASAYPYIADRVADARMVLVCGPRVDPATVEGPPGVEVWGYVPRLYEHLAACDVAIVQAGGTTTLELTALRRPFLYFPLEGHLEQSVAVAGRLARHGAGERHEFSGTSAQTLADAVVRQLEHTPTWPSIPSDGATRAAELILARLENPGGV